VVYKWYILKSGGLYGTYHLVREPETAPAFWWRGKRWEVKKGIFPETNGIWRAIILVAPWFGLMVTWEHQSIYEMVSEIFERFALFLR